MIRCHGFSTHPGEDGEEGEGDGCSGCIPSLVHRVVLCFGSLPLVGQKAEANEPQECPKGWDGPPAARQRGRGERSRRHVRANHKHIAFLWKLQPDETHQCTAGWAKFSLCRLSKLSEHVHRHLNHQGDDRCLQKVPQESQREEVLFACAWIDHRTCTWLSVQEQPPQLHDPVLQGRVKSSSFQGSRRRSSQPAGAQLASA